MAFGIKLIQEGVTLAAGTSVHPPPIAVDPDFLCFLSFTGTTTSYDWRLSRPAGSNAVISSATSAGPSFIPDIAGGTFTVTLIDDAQVVYTLDIQQASSSPIPGTGGTLGLIVDVAWWGLSTANYFNPANGKWYADALFASEADDDTNKFQQAIDYVYARGGGGVHFGGNWYFKDPPGAQRQFLTLRSGVNIFGDGNLSCVNIAPGQNTDARNGFSGVFGSADFTSLSTGNFFNSADSKYYTDAGFTTSASIDNVTLRDFVVDCNSKFNQFTPTRASVTYAQNAACAILQGTNNAYVNVILRNHAGIFGFLHGTYGFPEATTNVRIVDCHALHVGDDPQAGDTSVFACGAHKYTVSGCSVDSSDNIAWPVSGFPAPITAYEMHGEDCVFAGNRQKRCFRWLNIGGDSLKDVTNFNVYGGVSDGSICGITTYIYAGRSMKNCIFHDNTFSLVPGAFPTGEAGVDTAPGSAIPSNPDGNGYEDVQFYKNVFNLVGTPTAGVNSVGLRLTGNCKRVKIQDNEFNGWGSQPISIERASARIGTEAFTRSGSTCVSAGHTRYEDWEVRLYSTGTLPAPLQPEVSYWIKNSVTNVSFQLAATRGGTPITLTSAGTGTHYTQANIFEDITIQKNKTKDSGAVGARIMSDAVEVTPSHRRITIDHNEFTDSTGATMTHGSYISAPIDNTCKSTPNLVRGFTAAPYFVDVALFPTTGVLNHAHTTLAADWGIANTNTAAQNGALIQKAIDWLSTTYGTGGTLDFGRGVFLTTALTMKGGVYLRGTGPAMGFDTGIGTVLQVSGSTAALTATDINYYGISDLTIYQSGTGNCFNIVATAASNQHARIQNCGLVYNGTGACGVSMTCGGAFHILFPTILDTVMHGVNNSAGNSGIRTSSSSTGTIQNMRMSGGRIESVERGFELAQCTGAMVNGVALDACTTAGVTGRYIYLNTGAKSNLFTDMAFQPGTGDKAIEFVTATTVDNYITFTSLGSIPAAWIVETAGARNGWMGSDGVNQRNKFPYPTDFAGSVKFSTDVGFYGTSPVAQSAAYTVANPTTDRALDVTGDTLAQGLAVLGTLIADLKALGLIG